jgi:hypothetical protein
MGAIIGTRRAAGNRRWRGPADVARRRYNARMAAQVIRFPRQPSEPDDEHGLVEVHRCDQPEALVVRGLLESRGIPTLLRSRLAHSVHPFTVGAQGEAAILVPASEAARSRRLLERIEARRRRAQGGSDG